jgi:GT2 family glycosyltransferase
VADNYFVTAVLVSHDGAEWLPEVIASLFAQSRQIDRIVAVDNGSKDGSAKLISNAGITLIKSDRESGFGDAVALALDSTKAIKEDKEELIWLLHDDCAPNRVALANLISSFQDEPLVAMVGPKLRGWRDRNKLLEVGISIAVNGARWNGLETDELDQGQHDEPKEVLAVSTAAALIRRKVYEDLGGLDPNLAIFRDDIDFGWRLWLAGFEVKTSPSAVAFHAEAAANERRTVDVEEAFLHRPHLLDRRNAAFVLLANVSWWLIPWVALQLVGTAGIRAVGYLLAKLPGYALDEIAAVGLLIIKPNELRLARKIRKPKRLLSPRIIRQLIPQRGTQIRQAWERSVRAIAKRYKFGRDNEVISEPMSYADIGVLDETFDEQLSEGVSFKSRFDVLRHRPYFFALAFIFLVDIFASRYRYGSLSGGAMPIAHGAASDLLSHFGESWHPVAMGSASSAPTWVAIAGFLSSITLGNVSFLFASLYFLAPIVAFIAMYRVSKRFGLADFSSSIAGLIYAMSPVVWNSINDGRLGTLVLALVIPTFLSLNPHHITPEINWRRIYGIALFAGFIGAFSPLLLSIWTLTFLIFLGIDLFNRRSEIKDKKPLTFLMTANLEIEKRKLALGLLPIALNFPWSASFMLHPTQILLDPGLPLSGGSSISLALFNPGGLSGVPFWIISPILIYLIAILFSNKFSKVGVISSALLIIAIIFSPLHISGHGSIGKFWAGSLLIVIEALLIPRIIELGNDLIPNLRSSRLGLGHFVTAFIALLTIFSVAATSVWALTSGANSALRSGTPNVIPPFISSLSDTSGKPKTLVIQKTSAETTYFITRGFDLELGDPDVTVGTPPEIENAVDQMVTGTGIKSSKVLGLYGIQYVYMRNPIDQGLVRTIDGLGGFVRSSATDSGIVWKVAGSLPRLSIKDALGTVTKVDATDIGAQTQINTLGTVTLAEKYDGNWRLLVNNKTAPLSKSIIGEPTFDVVEPGNLYLEHDGTKRRALTSIQGIIFLSVLVLALPAGRRRKEMVEL